MNNLANKLFEIGFNEEATQMMINMILDARMADGRPAIPFEWTPPSVMKRRMPPDLETEQIEVVAQTLMDLKMTNAEISMFLHHARTLLQLHQQIRNLVTKLIKKPVLH